MIFAFRIYFLWNMLSFDRMDMLYASIFFVILFNYKLLYILIFINYNNLL